jgi:hypothetical protein
MTICCTKYCLYVNYHKYGDNEKVSGYNVQNKGTYQYLHTVIYSSQEYNKQQRMLTATQNRTSHNISSARTSLSFSHKVPFFAQTPDSPYPPDSDPPGRSCWIMRTIRTAVLSSIYRQLLEFICNKSAEPQSILLRTCLWLTDNSALLNELKCTHFNWGNNKKSHSLRGCRHSRIPLSGLCERAKSIYCYTKATATNPHLSRGTTLPPEAYISTFPPPGF